MDIYVPNNGACVLKCIEPNYMSLLPPSVSETVQVDFVRITAMGHVNSAHILMVGVGLTIFIIGMFIGARCCVKGQRYHSVGGIRG